MAGQIQEWNGSKEPRTYTPFVREAVRACARGNDPPISSADSLRALRTVFAIYSAAASGEVYERHSRHGLKGRDVERL